MFIHMNIDNIILTLYLLILLIVGVLKRLPLTKFSDYSTSNVAYSKLIIVATLFSTSVGGGTVFGLSEKAFSSDMSYTYGLLLSIPIDIVISIFIVPKMEKYQGFLSIGDIMHGNYGLVGRIIIGVAALFFTLGFLGAQIGVSSYIFEYMFKVGKIKAIIFSYSIVIIYTIFGGIHSILFTNLLQFFAIILTLPIITIVGFITVYKQGIDIIIPVSKYAITSGNMLNDTILCWLTFSCICLHPPLIQRIFISKDSKQFQKSILIKISIYTIFIILITLNGLLSYIFFPEINSIFALPEMVNKIFPQGIRGLIMIGFLAASISTADADLNLSAVTVTNDIIKPIFNLANQKLLLIIAQIITVIIATSSIYFVLQFKNVIDLVIFIANFWAPVALVPIIASIYDVVIEKKQFVITIFASILITIIAFLNNTGMSVFIGTSTNALFFILFYKYNAKIKNLILKK